MASRSFLLHEALSRGLTCALVSVLSLTAGGAYTLRAQQADSARVGVSRQTDSARAALAPQRLSLIHI